MTNDNHTHEIERIDETGHIPDQDGMLSLFVFGMAIVLILLLVVMTAMAM